MKNTSKLFKYMMEMYRNFPERFGDICSEAYSMVALNEQMQSFLLWVKQSEKKHNICEIRMSLRILNYFGRKERIPYGGLTDITDLLMLETVRDVVIDKNTLSLHMSVVDNINKLIDVYEAFLKTTDRNKESGVRAQWREIMK